MVTRSSAPSPRLEGTLQELVDQEHARERAREPAFGNGRDSNFLRPWPVAKNAYYQHDCACETKTHVTE